MIAVETQFGTVYHRELDTAARESVSSAVSKWLKKNPAPTPPLVKPEFGVKERDRLNTLRQAEPGTHPDILKQRIMDEAEPVPDERDPNYRQLLATWEERQARERFGAMLEQAQVIRPNTDEDFNRSVRERLIWKAALQNATACTAIYRSISFHSELTDELLWHWIDRLDLRYRGQPFAKAYAERENTGKSSGGGKPPPLLERIGRMVVSRGAIEALIAMDDLPIVQQGKLAARMMWSAWCESWDAAEARAKAKAEAQAKRQNKQKGRWIPT